MENVRLDLKYAVRSILAAPRFAAIVIVTLALGTGANTAVFSVLNALVLEPLPYFESDRLVRVHHASPGEDNGYLTGVAAVAYRDRSQTLDVAVTYIYSVLGADLIDGAEPERVGILPVGADYFSILGARPMLGQPFTRADERPNPRLAVIRERIWRRYLAGAPDAVGRSLTLDGLAFRVVAVLPDDFSDPLDADVDVWVPQNLQPGGPNNTDNHYLSIVARLKPGVTVEQAQAELTTIAASLQTSRPVSETRWSARIVPLQVDTVGGARSMLWILLGAVGLLMVIACANVASLLMARGAERETELTVRLALGCPRIRIVRQLLIESVLLSLAGAAAGLLLAPVAMRVLLAAAPAVVADAGGSTLDRVVLSFSIAIALLAGVGFGVAPALQVARTNLEGTLREAGRAGTGSRRQTRARNTLVVCQVALALVLLVGAGLLLRSFERLRAVAVGVESARVLTFTVNLPAGRYADPERRAAFHRDFHARLESIPGVRAAAAISRLPVTGTYHSWGAKRTDALQSPFTPAQQRVVEGRYFDALGVQLVRGRTFGPEDDRRAPRRVVVSAELARQMFPNDDPIGMRIRVAGADVEIIGVAGDVALDRRAAPRPYVYHAHSQFASDRNWALTQVVAMSDDRPTLLAEARRELARIDPALVLHEPRTLDAVIGNGIARERFSLLLVASFALLAIALAAIGLYGVLTYSVNRRAREMSIRLALGAPTRTVLSMIVRDGARLAAFGIVIGLAIAVGATRSLQWLLFGVSATEPLVFAAAAGILSGVALVASWIPARTATRTDPVQAMRE